MHIHTCTYFGVLFLEDGHVTYMYVYNYNVEWRGEGKD